MTTADEQFKRAQQLLAEKQPKLDTKQKLTMYGFYKQATVGKNTAPEPKKSDLAATYKYNAWKKVGDLSKDEAKRKFVEFARTVLPKDSKL